MYRTARNLFVLVSIVASLVSCAARGRPLHEDIAALRNSDVAFDGGYLGLHSVASGDFNGDEQSDLAVVNRAANNVSILLGTGTGAFGAATNFGVGTQPHEVEIVDVNGDGWSDLAVANNGSNNVSILLGTGTGTFGAATNVAVGTLPYSVAMGDFNGDGRKDLAVSSFSSNNVSILLNLE